MYLYFTNRMRMSTQKRGWYRIVTGFYEPGQRPARGRVVRVRRLASEWVPSRLRPITVATCLAHSAAKGKVRVTAVP